MTTHNHDILMAINSRIINGRSGGAKQLNADYKALVKARDEIIKMRKAQLQNARSTEAQPEQEPVAWRNAAIRLGEELSSVGPDDYYNITAAQWLDWALEQQPRGKNSLTTPSAAQRQRVVFPTMLRKMWSGSEVQAWLDETVNKENT
jgi:ATPase subunit of ABC transporter with duplicated ATPase domains